MCNKEELHYYYKVNVGLSAVEEIRKKFINSPKCYNTVMIKKENIEIFLQNILLSLENVNQLINSYLALKERVELLNNLYQKASEREIYFLHKSIEERGQNGKP